MSDSQLSRLRGMAEFWERRLAEDTNLTPRHRVTLRDELAALRYAIGLAETAFARVRPPAGVAWDHHFAIHSDCDWDWTGVPHTRTFTAIEHDAFPAQRITVVPAHEDNLNDGDTLTATYLLTDVTLSHRRQG